MAENKAFYTPKNAYNADYATNFCSTMWNARYLEKNEQNMNKLDPPPTQNGPRAGRQGQGQAAFSQS